MPQLFDYVKSVNKKDGQLDVTNEYVPFIVNRAFSMYTDTIFFANEMNKYASVLDKDIQYDFYYHGIEKNPKRFAPWLKKNSDKYLMIIMEYYKCSLQKAKEIVTILDNETLEKLEMKLNKGGRASDG